MYWNARNWKSLNWNWVYIYSKLIFYRFFFYHSCTLYKHITKCEKGKDKWETNAVWWAFETQIVWLFAIFRNDASYTSDTHAYARNRAYNAWHCNMIKHGIVVFVIHYPLRSLEKQQQQQQLCPYCWNWSQVHEVQQFMYARTHTHTHVQHLQWKSHQIRNDWNIMKFWPNNWMNKRKWSKRTLASRSQPGSISID